MKKRTGKHITPKRIDKVIEQLPENNFSIRASALKAGYAPSTAHSRGKDLRKAIENRINEVVEQTGTKTLLRGAWDKEWLIVNYRKIVDQDKDMGTKLKAIAPLLQESGELPKEDNSQRIVPVLQINFSKEITLPVPKVVSNERIEPGNALLEEPETPEED